jgi:hypothetical protein
LSADWCSIHTLGLVGHIEDIAVAKDQQGKKLGLRIIQALDAISEAVGCYKVCFYASETAYADLDRLSLTAQKRTKGFMSSVDTSVLVFRWHIITGGIRGGCR